jgi:uncharacterized membrane protein
MDKISNLTKAFLIAVLFLTIFTLVAIAIGSLLEYLEEQVTEARMKKLEPNNMVDSMIDYTENIIYTKDMRTGICFAWQYRRMATVDCDQVPDDLLLVVYPKPTPKSVSPKLATD